MKYMMILVALLLGCADTHGLPGDEDHALASQHPIVGVWAREQSSTGCAGAFLFGADGRYEQIANCDGDVAWSAGTYVIDGPHIYATPFDLCDYLTWTGDFTIEGDVLKINSVPFVAVDGPGPFPAVESGVPCGRVSF